MALTFAVLIILLFAMTLFVIFYNTLIFCKNRVFQSLSNINVLLKQRNDEIANLINVVKNYSAFEKEVLEKVTRIRSGYDEDMTVKSKSDFNGALGGEMKKLFALAEKYPDLKADKQYMRLQERITSLENQIADRREYYNWSVTNFNTKIEQFPYIIFAGALNFIKYPLFEKK